MTIPSRLVVVQTALVVEFSPAPLAMLGSLIVTSPEIRVAVNVSNAKPWADMNPTQLGTRRESLRLARLTVT